MIKPSKVKFISDELEKDFNSLKDDDFIKKAIIRAIQDLKENAFCGIQIPKKLFPKEYVQKYGINNLWIYNLPNSWRMLYVITRSAEVEIIAAILDWMNHKDYEKLFKF